MPVVKRGAPIKMPDSQNITVRLPKVEREALEKGRLADDRKLSQYVRILLTEGLKEEGLLPKHYKTVA